MTDEASQVKPAEGSDVTGLETESATIAVDSKGTKLINLPSGSVALMRKGHGKDIMHAMRAAGKMKNGEQMKMLFGLIAIKTRIIVEGIEVETEGAETRDLFKEYETKSTSVTIETVLDEMPDFDVLVLLGEVQTSQKKSLPSST